MRAMNTERPVMCKCVKILAYVYVSLSATAHMH